MENMVNVIHAGGEADVRIAFEFSEVDEAIRALDRAYADCRDELLAIKGGE